MMSNYQSTRFKTNIPIIDLISIIGIFFDWYIHVVDLRPAAHEQHLYYCWGFVQSIGIRTKEIGCRYDG